MWVSSGEFSKLSLVVEAALVVFFSAGVKISLANYSLSLPKNSKASFRTLEL